MIAELLLLQGLLEKTNMVTPSQPTTTTPTSTSGKVTEAVNKYKDAYKNYLKRFGR